MFLQMFQSVQMLQAQPIAACSLQSCPGSCPWLQAGRYRATGREAGAVGLTVPAILARKCLLGTVFLESVCLAPGLASGRVIGLANGIMRTILFLLIVIVKYIKFATASYLGIIPEDVVCDLQG